MLRRLLHQALNLLLGKTALVVRNRNLLRLARALLHRGNIQNTVRIHVKRHLNLGHTARHRRNPLQLELAEEIAVARELALALKYLDQHTRLVVAVRGKGLRGLLRNSGIALNEGRHDVARRLQTEAQRSHIQQNNVVRRIARLGSPLRQDVRLYRRAIGHGLIRIHAVIQLLATEILHEKLANAGNTARPAHHHNLINLALVHLRVLEKAVQRSDGATEKGVTHILKLGARHRRLEVVAISEAVHLNGRLRGRTQAPLCTLTGRPKTAKSTRIRGQVHSRLLAELVGAVRHKCVIKVLATQMGIASRGLDLKHAIVQGENTQIVRTPTAVKNQHILLTTARAIQAIGEGSRGRLVDNAQNIEPRNGPRILRGLALGIIKVRRHRDDRVLHRLPQISLGRLLHLLEHRRADLLRRELVLLALPVHLNLRLTSRPLQHRKRPKLLLALDHGVRELAPNQALRIKDRVRRVRGRLALGGVTNQTLLGRIGHIGRRSAIPLVVRDNLHAIILPNTHTRIGSPKINANRRSICSGHPLVLKTYSQKRFRPCVFTLLPDIPCKKE